MNLLPVKRACELDDEADRPKWLIDGLWAREAVGILGGEPKCCKSFLALDIAVSVASGSNCLRHFPVTAAGPVVFFPAEDSLEVVRRRLEGICAAKETKLELLPIYVITAQRLMLDQNEDRQRLRATIDTLKPTLLILDPFIRLHSIDENASKDVAPLLGFLRELQRTFHMAVLLVHHTRKTSDKHRLGQTLRGSSDLHGWGDSNLYLRRCMNRLTLSIEHRAALSRNDIPLQLAGNANTLALSVISSTPSTESQALSPMERVLDEMEKLKSPASVQQLRKQCRIRTSTLCKILAALAEQGRVSHGLGGYRLTTVENNPPLSIVPSLDGVSLPGIPIDITGNGNGKQPAKSMIPRVLNHQLS